MSGSIVGEWDRNYGTLGCIESTQCLASLQKIIIITQIHCF